MKPAPFRYAAPESVPEVLDLLSEEGEEGKLLAGGQSLMPVLNFRLARPTALIDLNRVSELAELREEHGVLRVGAMTRQRTLERWAAARPEWSLLSEGLSLVGHFAIRNRGTVGGSIAHADPSAELPALLLCLDGSIVARSRGAEREILASELFFGPLTTALQPNELLAEVRFQAPPAGSGWSFQEVSRRHGDFALVGVTAVVARDGDGTISESRLALFGVGDTPARATSAEQGLRGQHPTPESFRQAAQQVKQSLDPVADLHATAEYRRHVAGVLTTRALTAAAARCRDGASP